MIEAGDKDVCHDKVDEANDAGAEAKIGNAVEERLRFRRQALILRLAK